MQAIYVVIDIKEYERMVAALKLQKALADGERSAEQGGWLSAADVRKNTRYRGSLSFFRQRPLRIWTKSRLA